MRISEFTNAEEQLGLLRLIIDNTWGAIKQQADAQARQKAAQANAKPKVKAPKIPKLVPYAAMPKPLPNPRLQYKTYTQTKAPPMATQAHNFSYKQVPSNNVSSNPANNKVLSPVDTLKANKDKDELTNLSHEALPRKPL